MYCNLVIHRHLCYTDNIFHRQSLYSEQKGRNDVSKNDNEKKDTVIWYFDKFVMLLVNPAFFIYGFYLSSVDIDKGFSQKNITGFIIMLITILIGTPNIFIMSVNSLKDEQKKMRDKLSEVNTDGAELPLRIHRRLYFYEIMRYLSNRVIAIIIAVLSVYLGNDEMKHEHHHHSRHIPGVFLMFGAVVSFPSVWAYQLAKLCYRWRIIMRREYIVYHCVLEKASEFGENLCIQVNHKKVSFDFSYKYCGIKKKDIHSTPSTIVFVGDRAYIFPDDVL